MIREAAEFAEKAHRGAVRKGSDIPYITHPLETAVITSMMSDDDELIAAALLHDTMEDAGVSYEELKKHFGSRCGSGGGGERGQIQNMDGEKKPDD